MQIKFIATAAIVGFHAIGASAYQGEENPTPPQPFVSMQPRAAVAAQGRTPLPVNNGGTGVQAPQDGMTARAAVRANAVAAVRNGTTPSGERGGSAPYGETRGSM